DKMSDIQATSSTKPLPVEGKTVSHIYELVEAVKLVTKHRKGSIDPEFQVLENLVWKVEYLMYKDTAIADNDDYSHNGALKSAALSVKRRVQHEQNKMIRRDMKNAMIAATRLLDQYDAEEGVEQDHECSCGMCEPEIKEAEFIRQEYQRKRDRDAMLDGQLDEKFEEVEALRKKLRQTK
ncbi:hypothetical protein LTR40_009423, partial [Exophiala xenobiotica]